MMAYFSAKLTRVSERYERWEEHRRAHFAKWSVQRRWLIFVMVPVVLLCCGGTVIGAPLAWVVGTTIEAGRGAKSPDAASDEYLSALGYGQKDGLLPLLDKEHQSELLKQWQSYRSQMQHTDPPPSRLDFGGLTVRPVVGSRAAVMVEVAATWWPSRGGLSGGYTSEQLGWRFETRDSNGWRVSEVVAPAWCGGYVLASRCRLR
jgi:hypothetical protein